MVVHLILAGVAEHHGIVKKLAAVAVGKEVIRSSGVCSGTFIERASCLSASTGVSVS
jgi:hypothetical protein